MLVWPVNSPTAALGLNLLIARSSLALLDRHFGLMAASTGSPPVPKLQFQLLLDELFAYIEGYCSELVRWAVLHGHEQLGLHPDERNLGRTWS
jgi:hypothetical protein